MNEAPHQTRAHAVFDGLMPSVDAGRADLALRAARHTVPLLLVGTLAAMTLTGPVEPAIAAPAPAKPKGMAGALRHAVQAANTAIKTTGAALTRTAALAPATYQVVAGDTVSDIAGRFGLSTASVLALNGLDWSTLIFPGQFLRLTSSGPVPPVASAPESSEAGRYTIVAGDTISAIAARAGVSTLSILTANGLGWESIIYPGQTIAIPGPGILDAETVASVTPLAPAPEAAPAPVAASYRVVSGDTISGIAQRHGLSTQAVLDANGLTWESLIHAGTLLTLPGVGESIPAQPVTGLDAEATAHAATIIQVGRELGVPDYGIIIALATAMQESTMRNLDWGDRDSVGLFQQRPSSGWGTIEQLTTPSHAARLFYGGPSNPNAGSTRGLLDIDGWESMSLTEAAQAVQISAFPDAYAKWEASAREWFAALG